MLTQALSAESIIVRSLRYARRYARWMLNLTGAYVCTRLRKLPIAEQQSILRVRECPVAVVFSRANFRHCISLRRARETTTSFGLWPLAALFRPCYEAQPARTRVRRSARNPCPTTPPTAATKPRVPTPPPQPRKSEAIVRNLRNLIFRTDPLHIPGAGGLTKTQELAFYDYEFGVEGAC
uniref:Uncharacterized protein n=1 Tax=Anopheles farauti TaxID=69004 RepID=A0A182QQG0_9DIPT